MRQEFQAEETQTYATPLSTPPQERSVAQTETTPTEAQTETPRNRMDWALSFLVRAAKTFTGQFFSVFLFFTALRGLGTVIKSAVGILAALWRGDLASVPFYLTPLLKLLTWEQAFATLRSPILWLIFLGTTALWPLLVELLADTKSKGFSLLLLTSVNHEEARVRGNAIRALTRQLPLMTPQDAGLFDEDDRAHLYDLLTHDNPELALAAIQAMGQVCTTEALAHLNPLAQGEGRAAQDRRFSEAAQNALREIERRTLLRAADGEQLGTDTLLRPAAATPEEQPATLLRPSAEA